MNPVFTFECEIKGTGKNKGAYIEFPYDVKESFGKGGIIKVAATFNGYKYRGALANMGQGCHIIGITKAIRQEIGKDIGDSIEVTVVKDDASRALPIPEILNEELENDEESKTFFLGLTDSQRNKFITHITGAKREATQLSRRDKVMEMLRTKEKMK